LEITKVMLSPMIKLSPSFRLNTSIIVTSLSDLSMSKTFGLKVH
jgi:hypothetical protein